MENFNIDRNSCQLKGKYNNVVMVNPYHCYFIAHYSGGKIIRGKDLIDTGWKELPDGIDRLQYRLSNDIIINIPRFKSYLHLVEVSQSIEGPKLFHSVNIKGLHNNKIINYKIILKQDNLSKYKIGDIIITEEDTVTNSQYWKLSA